MGLVTVGRIEDFPENTARIVSLPNGEAVLLVNLEGDYYALEGRCSDGHLLEGAIVVGDERRVLCPTHGWEIDVERGVCLAEPECLLKKYDVRVEGEEVKIATS